MKTMHELSMIAFELWWQTKAERMPGVAAFSDEINESIKANFRNCWTSAIDAFNGAGCCDSKECEAWDCGICNPLMCKGRT